MKNNYWKDQAVKFGQVSLLALAICGGKVAFAEESPYPVAPGDRGGNGHNGHVIDVDMTPTLLDLTKKAVCEWKDGEELINELSSIQQTLMKLEKLDWYFAFDLKREMKSLKFCLTGALHKNPTSEKGSPVKEEKAARQAGIRLNEKVYLDREIFERMNEVNKSMLIIHETMHSYFSNDIESRSLKLRSMVSALNDVRTGKVKKRAQLHKLMKNNEIEFPLMTGAVEDFKASLQFLLASEEEQMDMILKATDFEALAELDEKVISSLLTKDQYSMSETGRRSTVEKALRLTLLECSDADFSRLLNDVPAGSINPAQVIMGEFSQLSQNHRRILYTSNNFARIIDNGLGRIFNTPLVYKNYMFHAPYEIQELGLQTPKTDLVPLYNIELPNKLPETLKWLPEMMMFLQMQNGLEGITKNEQFYRTLGLKNQKEQIQIHSVYIERERAVALERLDLMSKKLISLLKKDLASKLSAEDYEKMMKQIDFNRF